LETATLSLGWLFFCLFFRGLLETPAWHTLCYTLPVAPVRPTRKTLNFQFKMADINIRPLADRVLVEPAEAETVTASGLIIPDTAQEKPQRGKVVAVGGGKKDEPMTVKVGDMVLYGKYAGTELKWEGRDLMIMRESDILAVI
jgi:chaperonin GroES